MRLIKEWILDADWWSWKIGVVIYFLIGVGVGELMYRGFCWVKGEERSPKIAKDWWFVGMLFWPFMLAIGLPILIGRALWRYFRT